jgi:hypothetical protein
MDKQLLYRAICGSGPRPPIVIHIAHFPLHEMVAATESSDAKSAGFQHPLDPLGPDEVKEIPAVVVSGRLNSDSLDA